MAERFSWLPGVLAAAETDRDILGDTIRERLPDFLGVVNYAAFRSFAGALAQNPQRADLEAVMSVESAVHCRRLVRELKDSVDYGRAHTLVKVAFTLDLGAAFRALDNYQAQAWEVCSRNPDDGRFLAEALEVDLTEDRFRSNIKQLARILARAFEGPISDATVFLWFFAREVGLIKSTAHLPSQKGDRYNQILVVQQLGVAMELDPRLVRIRNATQHEDGLVITESEVRLYGAKKQDWGTIPLPEFSV